MLQHGPPTADEVHRRMPLQRGQQPERYCQSATAAQAVRLVPTVPTLGHTFDDAVGRAKPPDDAVLFQQHTPLCASPCRDTDHPEWGATAAAAWRPALLPQDTSLCSPAVPIVNLLDGGIAKELSPNTGAAGRSSFPSAWKI